jgi:GLPGLI family protein
MKNLLSTLLFITFLFNDAFSQNKEKAVGLIKYQFIHINDTNKRDQPFKEELVLLVGSTSSAYLSSDAEKQNSQRKQEIQNQIATASNPNSLELELTASRPVSNTEYYQFFSTKKLYIKHLLNDYYLTQEPLPTINWKIENITKVINGLKCQKATAHYKGRDYTAWFCTDIPVRTGPWKLNGLPGAIIEASDIKQEVIFKFLTFEDISNQNLYVTLPSKVMKASLKDIERINQLKKDNPKAYAKLPVGNNDLLAGLDPSRIKSLRITGRPSNISTIINNPIELPEIK